MRALWFVALYVGLGASISGGQQAGPYAPSPKPDAQPISTKVYAVGPGVTAPELLPLNVTGISSEECKKKVAGKVVFSLVVDATGQPRNPVILQSFDSNMDQRALIIVCNDRFAPGSYAGATVAVAQALEVDMQVCVEKTINDAGKKVYSWRLRSQPVQRLGPLPQAVEEVVIESSNSMWKKSDGTEIPIYRVGGGVSAPVVIYYADPEFSDEARREGFQGVCILTLVVDANGMPQDVRVMKPLKYRMSEKAIEAASKYRFKPAMKDGKPVPVRVSIEVNFHVR
jgi:TonB family protein